MQGHRGSAILAANAPAAKINLKTDAREPETSGELGYGNPGSTGVLLLPLP